MTLFLRDIKNFTLHTLHFSSCNHELEKKDTKQSHTNKNGRARDQKPPLVQTEDNEIYRHDPATYKCQNFLQKTEKKVRQIRKENFLKHDHFMELLC